MPELCNRRPAARARLDGGAEAFIGRTPLKCRVVDVSTAGLRLAAPAPGPVGRHFQIRFVIPAPGGPVTVAPDAVLARCGTLRGEHIWGVRFVGLDPTTLSMIRAYIDSAAVLPSGPAPACEKLATTRATGPAPQRVVDTRKLTRRPPTPVRATRQRTKPTPEVANLYRAALRDLGGPGAKKKKKK